MARYIDADAFKRKLIDEKSFFPAIVARALEEMPTADVVPKSEVDKWQNALMGECALTNCPLKTQLKAEVAREIFEEIDELIFQHGRGDLADKYFYLAMDELKKKYTEDKSDVSEEV